MTSTLNPVSTRSHRSHQELIMQNPQIRRNQTWRPVLALALLAGMATPAWAIDVSNGLKAARQATDRVELAAQTTAQVSDDPQVQEMASTVAYVADNVKTGITVAETAVTGNAILTGSGATIMKTLAGAGGPVVVAGATGLTAAKVMNETLYSNCDDQAACDAAQYGTYGGAAVGTVASATTVAVVGAGPAGLAAVGSVVGGGMVAGVTTLVAAPVVAAALVGGAVYWLFSD